MSIKDQEFFRRFALVELNSSSALHGGLTFDLLALLCKPGAAELERFGECLFQRSRRLNVGMSAIACVRLAGWQQMFARASAIHPDWHLCQSLPAAHTLFPAATRAWLW
jgi:hypothetical protein